MTEPATHTKSQKMQRASSAARLAAVQALYQMELTGQNWSSILGEFELHRFGETIDGEELAEANPALFKLVLEGAVTHQRAIDKAIDHVLKEGWPLKRIDPTLRGLFRAAGSEFLVRPNTPHRVIINEFVEVAKAFFDGDEPRFTNAVLDRIQHALREDAAANDDADESPSA